jgi:hypothetical protein
VPAAFTHFELVLRARTLAALEAIELMLELLDAD